MPAPEAATASLARGAAPLALHGADRDCRALPAVLRLLPGLALAAAIAAAALGLGDVRALRAGGVGALTLAIVLGMAVGNTVPARVLALSGDGVRYAKGNLLRLGIVLYGLRLTFQEIGDVGWVGIVVDAAMLGSTFGLAWWLGTRLFGLDRRTALLIGAGSSICGAAAVMATAPVVRARAEQVTVAVSTVVVYGTLAIFLYPAVYRLIGHAHPFAFSRKAYGVYAGSTIHEVAQVVAAGRAIGAEAADTAVITKMVRVMMLAPFLVVLSMWLARHPDAGESSSRPARGRIVVPWFAVIFVAVAGVHSLRVIPRALVAGALDVDTFVLATAMAALGLTTRVRALRDAGGKPLALAALLFAWLVVGGLAVNLGVAASLR